MDLLGRFFLFGEAKDWVIQTCLEYSHNHWLVLLSCLIAIFASYTAFGLMDRVRAAASGLTRAAWLAAGAGSMGGGVWSMHFVAMNAVSLPVAMHYDLTVTALSLVFAVAASAAAFRIVSRGLKSPADLAIGSLLLGSGIGAMHYTGMAALVMDASIRYDPFIFALSVIVAVALSAVALSLLCRSVVLSRSHSPISYLMKLASAVVMGLSIAAMHYTAMAATYFVPSQPHTMGGFVLQDITGIVAVAAAAIIGSTLAAALVDARMESKNRKIEESESFLAAVVDSIADGVVAIDDNGVVKMCNPASERMFGYDSGDIIGQNVSVLISPDQRQAHDQYVKDSHMHASKILGAKRALTAYRKDGSSLKVEISLSRMERESGDVFIGVCHDVTERELAEERLRESDKLSALGQLAGGVAHDFNNILMVIDGYTKRSLAVPDLPEKPVSWLSEVVTATDKAKGLTRQLLAFGRRQVQEKKVVEAAPVVDELDTLLRPLLGAAIGLHFSYPVDDARIEVDPALLTQALINLAINARDAMPNGGDLEITMGRHEADESFSKRHPQCQPGCYVTYAVKDQGEGMDAETQARIFEPFFTTKAPGKGTGLGLAMVHGFVHQSGGALEVSSRPGVGTTFTIFLPAVEKETTTIVTEAGRNLGAQGETILLAEDDEALRHLAEAILEDLGYRVLAAANGFDALELESQHEGPIHLLLSDVVMPMLGGFELIKAFRECRPEAKALLMSGYPSRGEFKRIDKPENVTLLQKPLEPEALALAIRDTLDEINKAA